MYPTQQPIQLNTQQPVEIRASSPRSPLLIGFGITEVILSKILLVWCIYWTAFQSDTALPTCLGIFCALVHIAVGILAIIGGRDTLRFRKCVVALLVLSIIGSAVFVIVTMIPLLITWIANIGYCRYCYGGVRLKFTADECLRLCEETTPAVVFSPIFVLIFLECSLGIILSGLSCCRLFKCCYTGDADTQNQYYNLRQHNTQHEAYLNNP